MNAALALLGWKIHGDHCIQGFNKNWVRWIRYENYYKSKYKKKNINFVSITKAIAKSYLNIFLPVITALFELLQQLLVVEVAFKSVNKAWVVLNFFLLKHLKMAKTFMQINVSEVGFYRFIPLFVEFNQLLD